MAAVDFVAVPTDSTHVTFDDLHPGRSSKEVVCRLLRFWNSRNINRDNQFMGITLLFLDEKNSLTHGFVPSVLANQFRPLLREGLIYNIGSFDVGRCTKMYKITESPFVIRFMDYTNIAPVEPSVSIERMRFMLRNFDHLQALGNTNLELPAVSEVTLPKDELNTFCGGEVVIESNGSTNAGSPSASGIGSSSRALSDSNCLRPANQAPSMHGLPDFAEVYNFIGSVFDPGSKGRMEKLKEMDPINFENCELDRTCLLGFSLSVGCDIDRFIIKAST